MNLQALEVHIEAHPIYHQSHQWPCYILHLKLSMAVEHFYRLDMEKTTVRNKIRGITSNEELDRIFDTDAERED